MVAEWAQKQFNSGPTKTVFGSELARVGTNSAGSGSTTSGLEKQDRPQVESEKEWFGVDDAR